MGYVGVGCVGEGCVGVGYVWYGLILVRDMSFLGVVWDKFGEGYGW